MQTAYDLVWLAAERTPNHLALVDDVSERRFTYAQLIAAVDRCAAGLGARGVGAGMHVATILPNAFDHCIALLALQRLAAVPMLLNFRFQATQLAELMRQGDCAHAVIRSDVVLANAVRDALPPGGVVLIVGEGVAGYEKFEACEADPLKLPQRPTPPRENTAFIFYTSGTTGAPRGVVISHRTSEHRIVWLSTQAGLRHGGHLRTLGMMPLSHAIGFYCTFLVTLAYNGTFFTMTTFNPTTAIDLIEKHKISYVFAVPTIYQALVSAPNYIPAKMSSLDLALFGGGPMPSLLLNRINREWPANLRHIYGTTEIMCGLYNPEPVGEPTRLRPGFYSRVRVVSIGGYTDDFTPIGQTGELIIDATGDSIFTGYLNDTVATANKVRDGWYYTGDVCAVRPDGDVDLIGRVDDMIRSGGETIYPEEIERLLAAYPNIKDVCVIGVPDPLWGEAVVACVVSSEVTPDWRALDAHCRSRPIASFKRPRAYFFLTAIPRNTANKPLRGALREMIMSGVATPDFYLVAA